MVVCHWKQTSCIVVYGFAYALRVDWQRKPARATWNYLDSRGGLPPGGSAGPLKVQWIGVRYGMEESFEGRERLG
jgi:hypothetical protein